MGFRNQEHYEKVKISQNHRAKPYFNRSNWLTYVLVAIFSVAIAPLITIRKSHIVPSSLSIYFHEINFFACALALVILPLLWVMQVRPYFEMKSGHCYIGRFEVKSKIQFLGYCYLLLAPGKRNWIKVNQKIFHSVKIGEAIELKRAIFGAVNEMKIVHNLRHRVNGACDGRRRKAFFKKTP